MKDMSPARLRFLLGIAALLFVLLAWHWISGWGLVTVHSDSTPLAKIIRSIERQGGVQIVTNADPSTPIMMDVDRVPPAEAVDVLAARLDTNWSLGYVAGPAKADVINAIAALKEGERNPDYARFGFGGGGFGMDAGDTVVDVRRVVWKVSPSDDQLLQSYLDQLAQKTGALAIVPKTWNPPVPKVPGGGPSASAIREMIRSVKGQMAEVFVIRVHSDDDGGHTADGGRGGPPRTDGGWGGGARGNFHPEWIQEREMARIEQLPPAEQEQAKKDAKEFADMRDMFQKMRALPEDQRRAAMQKFFDDPAVQERIVERQMSREAKRSPEKRADRFRQYVQYKQQMKSSQ